MTPIDEMVEALNAYRPEAMIAYASIVGALAEEQLEGRLAIEPRFTIATSEVLTDETMRRAEAAWGTAPFNTYAATEAPGIAMASPERVGMHVCEESVVVEVVDEDDRPVPAGLPGSKVLLTSLTNRAQPLVRYELSDAAVLAEGPDPSGRPFTRIARVDGRTSEILRFRAAGGGEVAVHPYRLRAPFSALLDVRQYQLVHERGGALVIRLVPRAGAPRDLVANVRDAVTRELAQAGVADPSVRIETVAAIERDGGHAAKVKLVTAA
jgi:phenylacetate-coenzyme A ligase PaaK-like adenylate-forming protein